MEATMNDQFGDDQTGYIDPKASQMAKTWQETVLSDAQILAATEGIGSVFPVQNAYQLRKYLKKQAEATWNARQVEIDSRQTQLKGKSEEVEATRLADEHWAWLGPLLGKLYKDAMIHGYKHGKEALAELGVKIGMQALP